MARSGEADEQSERAFEVEIEADGIPLEGTRNEVEEREIEIQTEDSSGGRKIIMVKPAIRIIEGVESGENDPVIVVEPQGAAGVRSSVEGIPMSPLPPLIHQVMGQRLSSPADWVRENIPFQPSSAIVAVYVRTVEQVEAEAFLQQIPRRGRQP